MKRVLLVFFGLVVISGFAFSQKCYTATGCKFYTKDCKDRTISWSGACENGYIDGKGLLKVYRSGKLLYTVRDCNTRKGKLAGYNYLEFASGKVEEGIFINGSLEKKKKKSCKVTFQDHITRNTERYEYIVDDPETGDRYLLKMFPRNDSKGWRFYYKKNGGSPVFDTYGLASSVEGHIRYFVDNNCACKGWSYR